MFNENSKDGNTIVTSHFYNDAEIAIEVVDYGLMLQYLFAAHEGEVPLDRIHSRHDLVRYAVQEARKSEATLEDVGLKAHAM